MKSRKTIAVLGAGFGGLRAAKKLAQKLAASGLSLSYEVILIDKNDHHTYTPLLYEVATTSKESANISKLHDLAGYNARDLIKDFPITFLQKDIESINTENKTIYFKNSGELRPDYMIVALGSETNYFDIPGLEENSIGLKNLWEAIKIRETISNMAHFQDHIRVIIGGGGPTGVELAGELKVWLGELKERYPKCGFTVSLIEASPNILPGLNKRVAIKARRRLNKLGVHVLENDKISSALPNEICLKSGKIMKFDVLIWAGGVKAPAIFAKSEKNMDDRGRLRVSPNLKYEPGIYALGDIACFLNPKTKKPIPGVARVAISQGSIAAHNIFEDIKVGESLSNKAKYKIYHPQNYPFVVPIGGKWAIAKIGPFTISGYLGWLIKGMVELNYFLSITNPLQASKMWFQCFWIFTKNDA